MRTITSLLSCVLSLCLVASGQAPPEFIAASIRPSAAPVQFEHDGTTEITPGLLTMRDVTTATCIKWAYGVQDSQIAGPKWLQSDHFDILARAAGDASADQMKAMMRSTLAGRFRLTFHRENRELQAYALTVAKGGPKLRESAPGTHPYRENTTVSTIGRALSMREFADFISGPLHMPVVDSTGLAGRYDFTLDFTAYLPDNNSAAPDNINGIIISALQGELGLKLESKKESVEVLVVDQVEPPSPN